MAILKDRYVKLIKFMRHETQDPEIHFAMIHDSQRLAFDSAWNPYQYGCSFILRG